MNAQSKASLPAPTLQSPDGIDLKEIAIHKYGTEVMIVITGQAEGTKVTAHFKVQGETAEWDASKVVNGQPLKIALQAGVYKRHEGKTATINYSTASGKSASLSVKIVK